MCLEGFSLARREDKFLTWLCLRRALSVLSCHRTLRCALLVGLDIAPDCQLCSVGHLLLFLNILDGCVNQLPVVLCPLLLREPGGGWVIFTSASAGAHVWGVRLFSATITQLCRKAISLLGLFMNKENIRPCGQWYRLQQVLGLLPT